MYFASWRRQWRPNASMACINGNERLFIAGKIIIKLISRIRPETNGVSTMAYHQSNKSANRRRMPLSAKQIENMSREYRTPVSRVKASNVASKPVADASAVKPGSPARERAVNARGGGGRTREAIDNKYQRIIFPRAIDALVATTPPSASVAMPVRMSEPYPWRLSQGAARIGIGRSTYALAQQHEL